MALCVILGVCVVEDDTVALGVELELAVPVCVVDGVTELLGVALELVVMVSVMLGVSVVDADCD